MSFKKGDRVLHNSPFTEHRNIEMIVMGDRIKIKTDGKYHIVANSNNVKWESWVWVHENYLSINPASIRFKKLSKI